MKKGRKYITTWVLLPFCAAVCVISNACAAEEYRNYSPRGMKEITVGVPKLEPVNNSARKPSFPLKELFTPAMPCVVIKVTAASFVDLLGMLLKEPQRLKESQATTFEQATKQTPTYVIDTANDRVLEMGAQTTVGSIGSYNLKEELKKLPTTSGKVERLLQILEGQGVDVTPLRENKEVVVLQMEDKFIIFPSEQAQKQFQLLSIAAAPAPSRKEEK